MIVASILGCSGRSPTEPPSDLVGTKGFLQTLAEMPVGLEVIHTPSTVSQPERVDDGPWPFRWVFQTEIRSIERPITIKYFGMLAWNGSEWFLPPDSSQYNAAVLDASEFRDWYSHPSGVIEPGKPAMDPTNWAGSKTLKPFKQKWIYIGTDASGKLYKGEAIVDLDVH